MTLALPLARPSSHGLARRHRKHVGTSCTVHQEVGAPWAFAGSSAIWRYAGCDIPVTISNRRRPPPDAQIAADLRVCAPLTRAIDNARIKPLCERRSVPSGHRRTGAVVAGLRTGLLHACALSPADVGISRLLD